MGTDYRGHIFRLIEKDENNSMGSKIYDYSMLTAIILSLIPLTTKTESSVIQWLDIVTCIIFIIDYVLRWITADLRAEKKGLGEFLKYPFSIMAIIDLLSILPTLSVISPAFKVLRVSRVFKILRVFKFVRYYEPLQIMISVIKKQARTLTAVLLFAIFYILVCALVMFNVEHHESFSSFFDAIYWSCCTLTTVGYGDIYPVSNLGRFVSMVSAIVGIALIALPSGIITSGYMEEIRLRKENGSK